VWAEAKDVQVVIKPVDGTLAVAGGLVTLPAVTVTAVKPESPGGWFCVHASRRSRPPKAIARRLLDRHDGRWQLMPANARLFDQKAARVVLLPLPSSTKNINKSTKTLLLSLTGFESASSGSPGHRAQRPFDRRRSSA